MRRADALLRRFAFVPQARLDDVMVSYATPGGGVGPARRFLRRFPAAGSGPAPLERLVGRGRRPTCCDPGDLLYLPPGVQHDGVALEPCFTYSIGFRAPRGAELGAAFLDWLHERGLPDARYRDPRLRPARSARPRPGGDDRLSPRACCARIRWSRGDVATLPRRIPHAAEGARRVLGAESARARAPAWSRSTRRRSSSTAARRFFINGEAFTAARARGRGAAQLADTRAARRGRLARAALARLISEWQRRGYARVETARWMKRPTSGSTPARGFQAAVERLLGAARARAARLRSGRRVAAAERPGAHRAARALPRREPHAAAVHGGPRHRSHHAATARACSASSRASAHAIQINRTHEHIRELQDAFLVLDSQHYVRRPVAAFYRGADRPGRRNRSARHAPALHGDLGSFRTRASRAPPSASNSGTEPELSSRTRAQPPYRCLRLCRDKRA